MYTNGFDQILIKEFTWPGCVQNTFGSTGLDQRRAHDPVNEITAITAASGTNLADHALDRAPILCDENTGTNGLCDDQRLYYLNDANFNVAALLDTAGDPVERYLYTPYGVATIYDATWINTRSTSSYANVTLYTGRELDGETGLYYYRNRYYGAQLGRFVSRDSVSYFGGMSLYSYVDNDPLNATDPTGEDGDWNPSDCPKTCKQHYGEGLNQDALDRLARKLKAGGGNVGAVYFSSDCGGTSFSLFCTCQIGQTGGRRPRPIYKRVVCINTTTFSDTCSAMQSLEHEFVHVHGGNEEKAYRKSCQVQAQQECWKCSMTPEEVRKKIDQCVKDGVPKSTGPTNEATIREGCRKLCDKYTADR